MGRTKKKAAVVALWLTSLSWLLLAVGAIGCRRDSQPPPVPTDVEFRNLVSAVDSTQEKMHRLDGYLKAFIETNDAETSSRLSGALTSTTCGTGVGQVLTIRWFRLDPGIAGSTARYISKCEVANYEIGNLRSTLSAPVESRRTLELSFDTQCKLKDARVVESSESAAAGTVVLPRPAVIELCGDPGTDRAKQAAVRLLALIRGTPDEPGLLQLGAQLGAELARVGAAPFSSSN